MICRQPINDRRKALNSTNISPKALAEAILRFTRLGNRRNAIGDNEMSEVPLLTEVLLHEIGRLTEGLATRNESGHSAPLDDSRPERT